MQTVDGGTRIKHRRYDSPSTSIFSQVHLKCRPWPFAKLLFRGRPFKSAAFNERLRRTEHSGLRRLKEIQAARIFSGGNTQRINPPPPELLTGRIRKTK